MEIGAITEYVDAAQVTLYVFWVFFFLVLFYLFAEGKREGYPLETDELDPARRRKLAGVTAVPSPKEFLLEDGSKVLAPDPSRADSSVLKARATSRVAGHAIEPDGDPLLAGVGPGAYAQRADTPDLTADGKPKIVPLRTAEGYHVDENDPDPRGMEVVGADGQTGGTVKDLWIDLPEHLLRFLEVDVGDGKTVLFPSNMITVEGNPQKVQVRALLASQFKNVPTIASASQVTRLEEDRIYGYFGAGTLYATHKRAEPLL